MAFRVKYSEVAADDLFEIISYISDKLCNPQAVERFYNTLNEKLSLLREHPYIFPLHHDEKLNAEGVHFTAIGNYLIFYVIDNDNSIVNIVRILYGRRDIPSVFEK